MRKLIILMSMMKYTYSPSQFLKAVIIYSRFVCKIWLFRQTSRCSLWEKYRQTYGKLEKSTEHLLAKLHPSNLMNTVFYLEFNVLLHKFLLCKFQFWKKLYLPSDSHANSLISDHFAYSSRWL